VDGEVYVQTEDDESRSEDKNVWTSKFDAAAIAE